MEGLLRQGLLLVFLSLQHHIHSSLVHENAVPGPSRFNRRVSGYRSSMDRQNIMAGKGESCKQYVLEATISQVFIESVRNVCAEAYNPDEEEEDTDPREQLSQVLDAMFERTVKVDEHVIDQGDDGDNFYVIERGIYDILVTKDNQMRSVGHYDNHGSFGELALMYNTPRAATIVATSEGSLWGLDRVTFRRIIVKNNANKRKMFESFIESVPVLKSLEVSERMKIVDVIGEKNYKDGECIITQGDKADSFYIIKSGEVRVMIRSKTKTNKDAGSQEVEIARSHKGQYFGELALVTNKPRAASVYAVGNVTCLVMDVQAFERLLGPCMDIMKRNISHYEEQLVKMFGSSLDLTDPGQ
ncbi:cAMP-dependent protein kinase type II-alpha regulatory subunit [Fukomys damarensis]|uniref:cAMP-dependent protein kinase type II-alpha regulatory subunit n=1 Tax=Fukomys damarensis TaxID=885580 RepID=A0A091CJC2_FUKDA|nr:cAMP-dependent protein kinase type II-alpha regulatory subunit [Fukomys damarensis]